MRSTSVPVLVCLVIHVATGCANSASESRGHRAGLVPAPAPTTGLTSPPTSPGALGSGGGIIGTSGGGSTTATSTGSTTGSGPAPGTGSGTTGSGPAPSTGSTAGTSPATNRTTVATGIYYTETFDGASVQMVYPDSVWEHGRPRHGPGSAASGGSALAVDRHDPYPSTRFAICYTTTIDLSGATRPVLTFRQWYDFEFMYDGGSVAVKSGSRIPVIEPGTGYPHLWVGGLGGKAGFTGSAPRWHDAWFDLSAFAGKSDVQVVFQFGSDVSNQLAGWFIDDIVVAEAPVVAQLLGPQRTRDAGAVSTLIFHEDFEGGPGAAQITPIRGPASVWETGTPPSKFHAWAMSTTTVAGTRLSAEYDDDVRADRLITTPIDFTGATRATLRFSHDHFAEIRYDGGRVLLTNDGQTFFPIDPITGYPDQVDALHGAGYTGDSMGWTSAHFDLTPHLATLGPRMQIAFEFASDRSRHYDGWAIDEVKVFID